MNGVIGTSRLLGRTRLDSRQAMLNGVVTTCGQQLLGVINDILDVSKVGAGKLSLNPAPFVAARMVHEPAQMVARLAEGKRLDLIVRVRPDPPRRVEGGLERLRQVVTKLVGDAVTFTAAGHVYVDVGGTVENGRLVLRVEVRDTGPGVPPSMVEHAFDRFTQVDASPSRADEGAGWGGRGMGSCQ